ncbi:trypsin-like peptidase domain-containing protein [Streptomyces sp. Ru73]|uniref:trypsin-like peptidase domain-containing protein n=1 Tax=Streptomyces sp. Ru73 TaxID=2080748 RepID=UPI0015E34966|nr:trypsin-like peptidase domain-containing protein [Streptomyces sp. Ru73]
MEGRAARPPWQVRIRRAADGTVLGGGVLCANGTVLTCAHVVGPGTEGDGGPAAVLVDFPFVERGRDVPARTVLSRADAPAGSRDDLAVLRPARVPAGACAAPLDEADTVAGHGFGVYGFPAGHPDGVWATGRLTGRTADGLLQFTVPGAQGYPPARGFSGSPLWDSDLRAVVGMVTAVDRDAQLRTAYAVPVDGLRAHWPDLAEPCPVRLWVHDPYGAPARLVPLRTAGPDRREYWVGRSSGTGDEADILLASPGPHVVSRWHCRLVYEFGHWFVALQAGGRPTFVRHVGSELPQPVPEGGRTRLRNGDTVLIPAARRSGDPGPERTHWELEFVDDGQTSSLF